MAFAYTLIVFKHTMRVSTAFIYVGRSDAIKINTPLTKMRKRICRSGFETVWKSQIPQLYLPQDQK